MGRSQETFNKKENIKKRQQKKKEKELRRENRQADSAKGKSLEDMFAYVDEYGNLTDKKPAEQGRQEVKPEDILISIPKSLAEEEILRGKVKYYNDQRGWGFINNEQGERFFFLIAEAPAHIKMDDQVQFKSKKGPKGLQAYAIEII